MKDMNSKTDMYRANAIRVLCRITDGTLLTQIERYLKQAIVDKNPVVASAALVSGIHLLQVLVAAFFGIWFWKISQYFLYVLFCCRQTQRLWKGGVMRFRKPFNLEQLLYSFMHWVYSTRYAGLLLCFRTWSKFLEPNLSWLFGTFTAGSRRGGILIKMRNDQNKKNFQTKQRQANNRSSNISQILYLPTLSIF